MADITKTFATTDITDKLIGYAEIYKNDNVTTQSFPTGTTYTKLVNFGANGNASIAVPDYVNNKITLTAGIWRVHFTTAILCNTNNVIISSSAFLAGVEKQQCHFHRKLATLGDMGAASFDGIIEVTTATADLDVRIRHDYGSSVDITAESMNLNVQRIG